MCQTIGYKNANFLDRYEDSLKVACEATIQTLEPTARDNNLQYISIKNQVTKVFSQHQFVKLSPNIYLEIDYDVIVFPSNPCLLDQDGVTSTIATDSRTFKSNVSKSKPIEAPQIHIVSPKFVRVNSTSSFVNSPFTPNFGSTLCSGSCSVHCVPS